ncbi:porin [Robiginitalea sp.]|uniref:porin n=1 Tax=Robiginitalea sp. TaxID=1902411 RepID=UPI003C711567
MKPYVRVIGILCFGFASAYLYGQGDSSAAPNPLYSVTGFVDAFYVYDFNKPDGDFRQSFLYNHNRHNEFNLNLGLLGFHLEHPRYRAHLSLQAGTYAIDNYAEEPGVLKHVFEAWAGFALDKRSSLWLDAGILPSHIGFESAVSVENWTLTRSLSAENSPYFLTGARLSYISDGHWQFASLVVNGWQRIQKVSGNSHLSFGTQVLYTPSGDFQINWSTFAGTDDPDTQRRMRYFSNLFGRFQISQKLGIITGFDMGIQQETKGSNIYNLWFTPTIIGQYKMHRYWQTAVRVEYYQDPDGVIIPTDVSDGFRTLGVSLNLDYVPVPGVSGRLEARWLRGREPVFRAEEGTKDQDFFIGASLAVKFGVGLNSP